MTSASPFERLAGPGNVLVKEPSDAKELAGLVPSCLPRLKDAENDANSGAVRDRDRCVGFKDMVAFKGKTDIGDQINKKIIAPLASANKLSDFPDFNDAAKLGTGKEMVAHIAIASEAQRRG